METLYFNKLTELKKEFKNLEKKLKVKMFLKGKVLTIEGEAIDEYSALKVLKAMQFGFSAKKSLLLLEPDMEFIKLHIRNFTRRKNLYDVRARIIGKEGKTKRTIENVSNCLVILNGNELGILGPTENMDSAITGLKNLIKGSKEGNVYAYMEKRNAQKRNLLNEAEDLGLKDFDKKDRN